MRPKYTEFHQSLRRVGEGGIYVGSRQHNWVFLHCVLLTAAGKVPLHGVKTEAPQRAEGRLLALRRVLVPNMTKNVTKCTQHGSKQAQSARKND